MKVLVNFVFFQIVMILSQGNFLSVSCTNLNKNLEIIFEYLHHLLIQIISCESLTPRFYTLIQVLTFFCIGGIKGETLLEHQDSVIRTCITRVDFQYFCCCMFPNVAYLKELMVVLLNHICLPERNQFFHCPDSMLLFGNVGILVLLVTL